MRLIYHVSFACFFVLAAPYYVWRLIRRGRWRRGFMQRFGFYPPAFVEALTNCRVIWFHAVSVGEVNVCSRLVAQLAVRLPNLKMVVSTTTSTGMGELEKRLPPSVEKVYYPVDFRGAVARAFKTIHPEAIVLVEAEIWPAFLWRASDCGIPVCLVNARLSHRSFRGYRKFRGLFQPLFASLAAVGTQNDADAVRFRQLGCRPEKVQVIGNLKFDAAGVDEDAGSQPRRLLHQLGVNPAAPILVGGSTHPGEEALLAEIVLRLKKTHPNLFLILVPRHFERAKDVSRELHDRGVRFVLRTEIGPETRLREGALDCLLVNTTGELRNFYHVASAVFVGKSVTAHGGQSPIEPAALSKAIVFGPHMENFAAIAAEFVQAGGALQVDRAEDLEPALDRLLANPDECCRLGERARAVVERNRGAVERSIRMLQQELRREEMFLPRRIE